MAAERSGFAGFEDLVTDLSDLPTLSVWRAMWWTFARSPVRVAGRVAGLVLSVALTVWVVIRPPRPATDRSVSYQISAPASQSYSTGPTSRSYAPAPPAAAVEEKPPVGQGAMLSGPQVRYCLAQGIRIEGAGKAVNEASKAEVTRFLALTDDFTPRCGNYRFALGVIQVVKEEVEAKRAALEREGAALIRMPAAGPR
jgi:hypothetical protein